ncbi:hypothetical protein PR048_023093 [Dryococelus australis]|uniref:Uncharacterized protein n=1 Tax=Dryococelus australis TaxID=614101 RepID=A0ABQ9GT45_9NEOP|nr:hypothetical protein PR048_023093 [Dryococelus australis]
MKKCGNKPELVLITFELLKQSRCAEEVEKEKKKHLEDDEKLANDLEEDEKLANEHAKKKRDAEKTGIQNMEKIFKIK